jgi:hypothetical protein
MGSGCKDDHDHQGKGNMSHIELRDQAGRPVTLEGDLIAAESSIREPGQQRWNVTEIYRRDAGGYVVSNTGMSILYHSPGATGECARRGVLTGAQDVPAEYRPCPVCWPTDRTLSPFDVRHDTKGMAAAGGQVRMEVAKPWIMFCETAEAMIASLFSKDGKTPFLSYTARRALEIAVAADPEIARAIRETRIEL